MARTEDYTPSVDLVKGDTLEDIVSMELGSPTMVEVVSGRDSIK